MNIHPVALACWLVGSIAITVSTGPSVWLVLIAASAGLAALSADRRSFKVAALVSLTTIALRVVLFALTGHTGEDLLFTTPSLKLPQAIGGLQLGGPVYLEPIRTAILEGLRLAAIVCAFGAAVSCMGISGILKAIPSFFGPGALIINVAMATLPQIASTITDANESLRSRGVGRLRRIPRLLLPTLANSLERSVTLAISMESRGFPPRTTKAKATGPWGPLIAAAGLGAAMGGAGGWGLLVAGGGAAAIFLRSRRAKDRAPRTGPRLSWADGAVMLATLAATAAAFLLDQPLSALTTAAMSAPAWVSLGGRP